MKPPADRVNSLLNMATTTNTFSSNMGGKQAASLTLNKGAASIVYKPFGDDITVDISTGKEIAYIDWSNEASDIWSSVSDAVNDGAIPVLRDGTDPIIYAPLLQQSSTEIIFMTTEGSTFTKYSITLEDEVYTKSTSEVSYSESEVVYINWVPSQATGLANSIYTAVAAGKYPIIRTPGSSSIYAPITYIGSAYIKFTGYNENTIKIYELTNNFDGTFTASTNNIELGSSDLAYITYTGGDGWTQTAAALEANKLPLAILSGANVTRLYVYNGWYTDNNKVYQFVSISPHSNRIYTMSIDKTGVVTTGEISLGGSGSSFDLDANLLTEAPITKSTDTSGVVTIGMNPVTASPLSLIVTPPIDVVNAVVTAIGNAGADRQSTLEATKPGFCGHCFNIPNYYQIKSGDKIGFMNINTVSDIKIAYIAIYRWDKDENKLNLLCMTDNIADQFGEVGFTEVDVTYINPDSNYAIIKPYSINYACVICDQTSLQLAGTYNSAGGTFNSSNPFVSFHINSLANAYNQEVFIENWGQIDLGTVGAQEESGFIRQCIELRHNED